MDITISNLFDIKDYNLLEAKRFLKNIGRKLINSNQMWIDIFFHAGGLLSNRLVKWSWSILLINSLKFKYKVVPVDVCQSIAALVPYNPQPDPKIINIVNLDQDYATQTILAQIKLNIDLNTANTIFVSPSYSFSSDIRAFMAFSP